MFGNYWLASYPKSGNTWVRIFINNLLSGRDEPVSINNLQGDGIASSRVLFDNQLGISSADLEPAEIHALRADVFRSVHEDTPANRYIKIHDAYIGIHGGPPPIPPELSLGVVYLIRNPLDLAISLSNHLSRPVSKAVDFMCDPNAEFARNIRKLSTQLSQLLLSWSGHVLSWVNQTDIPLLIIRYEDLLTDPFQEFGRLVAFLKLDDYQKRIPLAIRFSSIEELQKQELVAGFREKPPNAKIFFRNGEKNIWQKQLGKKDIRKLIEHHGAVMERFGYPLPNINDCTI